MKDKELAALHQMRASFEGKNGFGLELNDATFLRYLRARYQSF